MGYVKRVIRRLKSRFVNWLLSDVSVEYLRVLDLHVGKTSMKVTPDSIIFHSNTSDPSSVAGQMWYRSDLRRLRINTGAGTFYVALITGGSGAPSGSAPTHTLYIDTSNQIMYYYTGSSWVPLGAVYK